MDGEILAWIVLRAAYAWMFLVPVPVLLRDWPRTVETTALLFTRYTEWFARASLAAMIFGSVSILFGIYGRLGALALLIFSLGGAIVHKRLAQFAFEMNLSGSASAEDQTTAGQLRSLAFAGHMTSGQKNYVLAALALFFLLQGTGPASLMGP